MADSAPVETLILGAGVAGALVALRLAQAGRQVVLVEAGGHVDRAAGVTRMGLAAQPWPDAPFPDQAHAPRPRLNELGAFYAQRGSAVWSAVYERQVGGTTWHWAGVATRLQAEDLALRTRFGVGVDWPIGYAALDYAAAEQELGVSGSESVGSPREAPFPLGPVPLSHSDRVWQAAAAKLGLAVTPAPQARGMSAWGERPACCGSGSCVPLCPIGAKYDGAQSVARAVAAGATLRTDRLATRLHVGGDGRISAVTLRAPDGTTERVTARRVVLACNPVETARLLLASRTDALPAGVANRSDQVGRNLMDHVRVAVRGLADTPVFTGRGPVITAHIHVPQDRAKHAGLLFELLNDGDVWERPPAVVAEGHIRAGLRGSALDAAIRDEVSRQACVAALVEQLPSPDNRVQLAGTVDATGQPTLAVTWAHDPYTLAGVDAAWGWLRRLGQAIGLRDAREERPSVGQHPAGTCRMGTDPLQSVVDADLQSHDHPNLHIVGGAVFPTLGTRNPTLTIAALALRLGARLAAG